MRVMIEFNPITGVIKVMSPTSTEGESLIQPVAIQAIGSAAQDAGPFNVGIAFGEQPSAKGVAVPKTGTQPAIKSAAQDAGKYNAGITLGERSSTKGPQSTTSSIATATESTSTPTIIDRF